MAWHSHGHDQASLVDSLVRNGLVTTPAVETALRKVDRRHFCCAHNAAPYRDAPQRTPYAGATISAPHMHAQCLELVARFVRRRADETMATGAGPTAAAAAAPVRILDVGCGTGYLLAALAHLAVSSGAKSVEVVGVERIKPLAQAARELLCRGGGGSSSPSALLPSSAGGGGGGGVGVRVSVSVTVVEGDGHAGWAAGAPYDVIHVGAAVKGGVPSLLAQLAPGGGLVVPLVDEEEEEEQGAVAALAGAEPPQALWLLEKGLDDPTEVKRTRVMPVVYVPLVKEAAPSGAGVVVGSACN